MSTNTLGILEIHSSYEARQEWEWYSLITSWVIALKRFANLNCLSCCSSVPRKKIQKWHKIYQCECNV